MDTEKVYSIKHCHIDVTNVAIQSIAAAMGQKGGIRNGSISRD